MPSLLRIVGLVVAVALVIGASRRLRRRGVGSRVPALLAALAGVALALVSLVPDLVRPLQDFFGLAGAPLGRLITVLVLAVAGAFGVALYALVRAERSGQRVASLVTAQAIAEVVGREARLAGILVCVPAFNEAEGLAAVLATIPHALCGRATRTLVVDDGSTDGTADVARTSGAIVARHPINPGQGAALRSAYGIASELGAEIVVTFDADGQHDAMEMERLVLPIVNDEADFVVGSRLLGSAESTSRARAVGVGVYTGIVNVLGGTRLTDVANGYRAMRVGRLTELVFKEEQYHNPELLLGVARAGLRIREVPVTIRRRSFGRTKKGRDLRYGLGFLRVVFRTWLR